MKNERIRDYTGIIRYIALAVAIAFCAYGAYSGQAEAVLRKAAAICMECCGIG